MTLWQEFKLALGLRSVWNHAEEAAMADAPATTGKGLVTSKTFWANILAGLIGFAPQVQAIIPPQYYSLGIIGMNLALRLITKQPITGLFNIPS